MEDARSGRGAAAAAVAAAVRLAGGDPAIAARIADAPPGYLLALDGSDVARHAGLLSPVPSAGEVRVVATPGPVAREWHVDVAARDRPGLLAACTGVLADLGVDVVQAVLATWEDGAALEAFVVRSPSPPDVGVLHARIAASLDRALSSPPLADASVRFDHAASPAYTACEVRTGDRPGLLHALAVAFAASGCDVHAALVTTLDGRACDRFDLTDRAGRKIDLRREAAIRAALRDGVGRRPRWRRPRR